MVCSEETVTWIVMILFFVHITASMEGNIRDAGTQPDGVSLSLAFPKYESPLITAKLFCQSGSRWLRSSVIGIEDLDLLDFDGFADLLEFMGFAGHVDFAVHGSASEFSHSPE